MKILEKLNRYKTEIEKLKFKFSCQEISKSMIGELETEQDKNYKINFHKNVTEKKVSAKIKKL